MQFLLVHIVLATGGQSTSKDNVPSSTQGGVDHTSAIIYLPRDLRSLKMNVKNCRIVSLGGTKEEPS